MKPKLHQQVSIRRDVPQFHLLRGDLATLIDHVPHPSGGEDGVVLEVFNALGEAIAVVTVPESDIEILHSDEVFSVRSLARSR